MPGNPAVTGGATRADTCAADRAGDRAVQSAPRSGPSGGTISHDVLGANFDRLRPVAFAELALPAALTCRIGAEAWQALSAKPEHKIRLVPGGTLIHI